MIAVAAPSAFTAVSLSLLTTATSTFLIAVLTADLIDLLRSAFVLLTGGGYPLYYIAFSIFLIWIPIGKTRHLLYFFYARYHLGAFYGRRGT